MSAHHRLLTQAMRGSRALCQPQDYPELRALAQQVQRGFRAQIVHGQLADTALDGLPLRAGNAP